MSFVTIDSETCGLHGPIVLLQYAEGDGPVHLYSVWKEPIDKTLQLIEWITNHPGGILGFNLTFDWFKVCQLYTTLLVLKKRVGGDALPEDHIDTFALCEPEARDGPCLKPVKAMDLMLFARKGPYQNLMARDDIKVKRVPSIIAHRVADELEKRIALPDIFFAKRKDKRKSKWAVEECKNDANFSNIVLRFAPSSALKALATHELGLDPNDTLVFSDVEVDRKWLPEESGSAPFALAIGKPGEWNGAWPEVIHHHFNHWTYNDLARTYAERDIVYPRALFEKWGKPEFGDVDSTLACLVGAARWKGYSLNLQGITALREDAKQRMKKAPRSRNEVLAYISEVLSPEEELALQDENGNPSTKKVVLEEISKLKSCKFCLDAVDHAECRPLDHPAAIRAKAVLDSRKAKKEVELYDKLLQAGRLHAAMNIIGTRSSRMSGGAVSEQKRVKKSGSLNAQGIQKKKEVRQQFTLRFSKVVAVEQQIHELLDLYEQHPELEECLVGGDFESFEVGIADAYYLDPQLFNDLNGVEPACTKDECKFSNEKCIGCKHGAHIGKACEKADQGCACTCAESEYVPCCSRCTGKPAKKGGIKIHAVIGMKVYPHHACGNTKTCGLNACTSYWDIKATSGKDPDLYTRAKSAFFALLYFGNAFTLASRLGIPTEEGDVAYNEIMALYPVMGKKREEFFVRFCPIRQPKGIGTQVTWTDPEDYVESMIGFRRYFTLENQIIRALFDLANDIPEEWRDIKIKVQRRDRLQTVAGSVASALYAAAFQVQGANMRAAGNHVIQSTGAQLTKMLQREIWDLQPAGIHHWYVRPMNVHDELPTTCAKTYVNRVAQVQKDFIQKHKSLIRMIGMEWKESDNWAGIK